MNIINDFKCIVNSFCIFKFFLVNIGIFDLFFKYTIINDFFKIIEKKTEQVKEILLILSSHEFHVVLESKSNSFYYKLSIAYQETPTLDNSSIDIVEEKIYVLSIVNTIRCFKALRESDIAYMKINFDKNKISLYQYVFKPMDQPVENFKVEKIKQGTTKGDCQIAEPSPVSDSLLFSKEIFPQGFKNSFTGSQRLETIEVKKLNLIQKISDLANCPGEYYSQLFEKLTTQSRVPSHVPGNRQFQNNYITDVFKLVNKQENTISFISFKKLDNLIVVIDTVIAMSAQLVRVRINPRNLGFHSEEINNCVSFELNSGDGVSIVNNYVSKNEFSYDVEYFTSLSSFVKSLSNIKEYECNIRLNSMGLMIFNLSIQSLRISYSMIFTALND